MENLETKIYRQRLIIEGHYLSDSIDGEFIREYLIKLSKMMEMRIFSGPYSWPPDVWDNPEIVLHDLNGFVAWTESGCHVYAWREYKFFSVDIYSCKKFNSESIIEYTRYIFRSTDLVYMAL